MENGCERRAEELLPESKKKLLAAIEAVRNMMIEREAEDSKIKRYLFWRKHHDEF